MIKKVRLVLLIAIFALLIGIGVYGIRAYESKIAEKCVNADLIALEKEIEGMKVTIFGGSNEKDRSNIRSMGYMIRTKNGEVIFIDGGDWLDYDVVTSYIDKYTDGLIDHWFVTHAHSDHVGALKDVINKENNYKIENIYYNLLTEEWYKKNDARGYDSEKGMLDALKSDKILNHVICEENQKIKIDNLEIDILRVANPEITNGDNGNEASMVFKVTALDVNKSMVFLGDAMTKASPEILEVKDRLKADAVQMAHHGNWGVTKEVYEAISPNTAFYNSTEGLYNNDAGAGYNTGKWDSIKVRGWLDEIGVENKILAFEGDQTIHFNSRGLEKINNYEIKEDAE